MPYPIVNRCRGFLAVLVIVGFAFPCRAQTQGQPAPADGPVEVAVELPLSGEEAVYGRSVLEGLQLAVDEAGAVRGERRIVLKIYDDRAERDYVRTVAEQIVASNAPLVLGPSFSWTSLITGQTYAAAGVTSLPTTATADSITRNATTFRVIFKNSDQGELLANYLVRVLGQKRASVIWISDGYGETLHDGFDSAAKRLGLETTYATFATSAELDSVVRTVATSRREWPIVLLMLDAEAAQALKGLRRLGATGPFLGGDALGDEVLSNRLANEPEERDRPGYFTEGVYGISPVILDSANAETLAFAERFRARFGHSPVWQSVTGYDTGRLAVSAVQNLTPGASTEVLRREVLEHLRAISSPERAVSGLLGPIWFDPGRGRVQAIRIGQFHQGRFESAPTQLVPVSSPDVTEVSSGSVFEVEPGRYVRLQRVVYTGVFINEIPRIDVAKSTFGADFYLWLRYAGNGGPLAADPTDINFPTIVSGTFDREHPAEQGEMPDGTVYRLWRVQADFRNDFDLHRFPFDEQSLALSFFNARAASDRIVYVLDRRSSAPGRESLVADARANTHADAGTPGGTATDAASAAPGNETRTIAAAEAFRNLTQWVPLGVGERRDNLVTDSPLGDPRRVGVESYRELSGFQVTVGVQRRALATLSKSLMPLLLMTLIMFASLYFPHGLVKEKVTVAITGALSGAVLLTAVNSQLGGIGYTVAVEYAFYIFFGLSTLCIVSVLGAERLRVAGRTVAAVRTERLTRLVFVLAIAVIVVGAVSFISSSHGTV